MSAIHSVVITTPCTTHCNTGCGLYLTLIKKKQSMHSTLSQWHSQRKSRRSDVFNGILAAHIFPSLADVLTEPLGGADDLGPLDLSLRNIEETSPDMYSRGLAEEDFLNPNAMETEHNGLNGENETDIQELSSPGDLLIPLPMWSDGEEVDKFDDNCEVGLVEYEIMASVENTEPPCYPHSPGSVGDMSDYSSDCSVEPGLEVCTPQTMIELEKIDVRSHVQNTIVPKVKIEPENLPENSVYKPYYCSNGYEDSKRGVMDMVETYDEEDSSSDGSVKSSDKQKRKRPGRKKGQTSSVYHLWEFIRDLLQNPEHCPKIIKWEDEEEGIFRVLKSTEVAKEWGSMKKNKTKMTYEKLSRSLRYSRKEGYFDDIPKDRGLPKKLCFKFGPKSHGWRRNT